MKDTINDDEEIKQSLIDLISMLKSDSLNDTSTQNSPPDTSDILKEISHITAKLSYLIINTKFDNNSTQSERDQLKLIKSKVEQLGDIQYKFNRIIISRKVIEELISELEGQKSELLSKISEFKKVL